MNIKILLIAISAATISSCSTTYRSGQTPDDVYYSPKRVIEEDDTQDTRREEPRKSYYQDREIRMAVYDRRWRDFNDEFDYKYDPYHYGYSYGYYYNPYYCHYPVYLVNVPVVNPKNTVPRMTNLGSYNNTGYVVPNVKSSNGTWINSTRPYNNSNSSSSLIRRILTTTTTNTSNSSSSRDNSTRSYSPSSSSSSGSSGRSGTPVSRPSRGH